MAQEKFTDAIALLKADHRKVEELFEKFEAAGSGSKQKVAEQICNELKIHTMIEEEIFYPAFARAARTNEQRKLLTEAYEEHRAAERLVLPDLEGSDVGSNVFGGRAKVLKDLVEHHAEEEEREMFPVARRLLDRAKLLELGDRMQARKDELLR